METERIFKALGEPTRLQIFRNLLERKHCVRSLSRKLGITESAVSQHLKVLREAGLIYGEKYGYHTHYLPEQAVLDAFAEAVCAMRDQSRTVDRESIVCNCEVRGKENE